MDLIQSGTQAAEYFTPFGSLSSRKHGAIQIALNERANDSDDQMKFTFVRRFWPASMSFLIGLTRVVAATGVFWAIDASAGTGPRVLFARPGQSPSAPENTIVLPEAVPDPIEPVNRWLFGFNKAAMTGVVKPSGKVYRAMVLRPLRIGISNVGRNIAYPKRLVNNLLQARWAGAGDETSRFLCNSVLGVGGLFDIATRWDIPASEADFGQTFWLWGWKQPALYLMLPILGPSNERDSVGAAADSAVNPLSYFAPYSYIPMGITYNDLTDSVDEYVRLSKVEADPYYVLHYASTFKRDWRPVALELNGEQDPPSLETLGAIYFTFRNKKFPEQGKTRNVLLSSTARELPYRYWLQPKKAPIVYISPGVGSHRLNGGAIALAELLYENGFSVVTVSSVFNYEFMERASTADVPGYTPEDAHDLHFALTSVDKDLERAYPGRLGSRALMGYSMGGFHTLFIASGGTTNSESLVHFDRYVAIDSPVRLLNCIAVLDRFFAAALDWPAEGRTKEVENTFYKVSAFAKYPPSPETPPPFNSIESKFLVALAFRLTLRDMIFSSQLRHPQGVLQTPLDPWKREPAYREIMEFTFSDYLNDFVAPYYLRRGINLKNPDVLDAGEDLRPHSAALRGNQNIRVIENKNDILLDKSDVEWFESTFEASRVTFFEHGGHLGNLMVPEVQKAILRTVEDLKR